MTWIAIVLPLVVNHAVSGLADQLDRISDALPKDTLYCCANILQYDSPRL